MRSILRNITQRYATELPATKVGYREFGGSARRLGGETKVIECQVRTTWREVCTENSTDGILQSFE